MACADLRDELHFDLSGARRCAKVRTRLALALTASLFLHSLLGTGLTLEVPGGSRASAAPFTVRLQQLAAASESETRSQQNTAPLEPNALRLPPSRAPVTALGGHGLISGQQNRSRATRALAGNGEAPGLVLQSLQSADRYYTVHDLDVYPALRDALQLKHPDGATRTRVSGRALVMLALNEAGVLDDVSIVQSEPQGYFEDAVRVAFGAARFFPAQKNGRAVKSRILINLEFEPD